MNKILILKKTNSKSHKNNKKMKKAKIIATILKIMMKTTILKTKLNLILKIVILIILNNLKLRRSSKLPRIKMQILKTKHLIAKNLLRRRRLIIP